MSYNQTKNTTPNFHRSPKNNPKELNGNCILENGEKYLELRKKYGSDIKLISKRIPQFKSKKNDEVKRRWAEMGKKSDYSENYRYHIFIHNIKKDQYIDVANGRCMMMDRLVYQELHTSPEGKKVNNGYVPEYSYFPHDMLDYIKSLKRANSGLTDIELLCGVVSEYWWSNWGW
tara:strand:+ start:39 stop:560 length:522 start_codon:yes stop_codon:yes gene_type:complete